MKKLTLISLLILGTIFLTACSCAKESEYTVTFDSNGGSIINSQTVKSGSSITEPNAPIYDGYTFDGWYLNDQKFDFSTKITKDLTLKAKWTEKTNGDVTKPDENPEPIKPEEEKPNSNQNSGEKVAVYTVTFDSDGGNKVATKYIQKNYKAKKPADPTKEGYKFLGWYLNEKEYNFNTKVTKNITLKAKWEKIVEEPKIGYLQEDVETSIVGETYLYVTKDGVKVDGYLDITTVEGTTVTKEIKSTGYKTNKNKITKITNPRVK